MPHEIKYKKTKRFLSCIAKKIQSVPVNWTSGKLKLRWMLVSESVSLSTSYGFFYCISVSQDTKLMSTYVFSPPTALNKKENGVPRCEWSSLWLSEGWRKSTKESTDFPTALVLLRVVPVPILVSRTKMNPISHLDDGIEMLSVDLSHMFGFVCFTWTHFNFI